MITIERLRDQRAKYVDQLRQAEQQVFVIDGAIQAIDALITECDSMTIDELGQMIGAVEIGEPEPLKGGE